MNRRIVPGLVLLTAVGCGGNGQQTTSVMSPSDPTSRSANMGGVGGAGAKPDPVFKPVAGLNSPLGTLRALSEKHPLAKPADGKVAADSVVKLAKLDKDGLKLDDGFGYFVADAQAPHINVGAKELSVPLPVEAKINPDGTVWVVDAETRRIFTLLGVKREADKPAVATDALNGDLVRPAIEGPVPALGLVARAEEATGEIKHALRILVKGVGTDGAPEAGARIRLKKSVSEKGVPPLAKSLIRALKRYGAVLETGENGPVLPAISDPRWTKEDMKSASVLHITDFELLAPVVKTAPPAKPKI